MWPLPEFNPYFLFFNLLKLQPAGSSSLWDLWGAEREASHRYWKCPRLWRCGLVCTQQKDRTVHGAKPGRVAWWKSKPKAVHWRWMLTCQLCDRWRNISQPSRWKDDKSTAAELVLYPSKRFQVYKSVLFFCFFYSKRLVAQRYIYMHSVVLPKCSNV